MSTQTERRKVGTDFKIMERLSDVIPQDLRHLERSISEKFHKLEKCHANERIKLTRMKMGKLSALVYLYPALTMFDPDMAKLRKHEEDANYNTRSSVASRSYYSSDEEDSDYDRPIDYKEGN